MATIKELAQAGRKNPSTINAFMAECRDKLSGEIYVDNLGNQINQYKNVLEAISLEMFTSSPIDFVARFESFSPDIQSQFSPEELTKNTQLNVDQLPVHSRVLLLGLACGMSPETLGRTDVRGQLSLGVATAMQLNPNDAKNIKDLAVKLLGFNQSIAMAPSTGSAQSQQSDAEPIHLSGDDTLYLTNASDMVKAQFNMAQLSKGNSLGDGIDFAHMARYFEPVSYTHLTLPTICSV